MKLTQLWCGLNRDLTSIIEIEFMKTASQGLTAQIHKEYMAIQLIVI
jgi:hypothetical protein